MTSLLRYKIMFRLLVATLLLNLTPGFAEIDVYLLAGQSNMDGRGKVEKLTEKQCRPSKSAEIFYRNPPHASEGWQPLQPGYSIAPKYKGGLPSPTFGPEIGFAEAIGKAAPDRRFAFIKGSKGGTSLRRDWKPGVKGQPDTQGERYRYFIETVKQATEALAASGQAFRIRGLLWHQGESDSKASAEAHQKRLVEFAARLREDVGVPDLPIVVGQVFDNGKRDTVRAALRTFSEADPACGLVTVEGLTTWDAGTHFDAKSQLLLGERYAEALLEVQAATEER